MCSGPNKLNCYVYLLKHCVPEHWSTGLQALSLPEKEVGSSPVKM